MSPLFKHAEPTNSHERRVLFHLSIAKPSSLALGKCPARGRPCALISPRRAAPTSASPKSAITLYGINPATGGSTATVVKGAAGFVMSFEYHAESGKMVMAVGTRSDASSSFYTVDLDTVSAVVLLSLIPSRFTIRKSCNHHV